MTDNYYEATVSSQTLGQVFNLVDWVSDSSLPLKDKDDKKKDPKIPTPVEDVDPTYLVFPWGVNDPAEGNRSIVQHSKTADRVASPYGWHSIPLSHVPEGLGDLVGPIPKPKPPPAPEPLVNFTVTAGNNVFAQENFAGRNDYLDNFRPDAGAEKKFVWKYDPVARNDSNGRMEEARKHVNATITQLFVTSNLFHDLMYRYVCYAFVVRWKNLLLVDMVSMRSLETSSSTISAREAKKMTLLLLTRRTEVDSITPTS